MLNRLLRQLLSLEVIYVYPAESEVHRLFREYNTAFNTARALTYAELEGELFLRNSGLSCTAIFIGEHCETLLNPYDALRVVNNPLADVYWLREYTVEEVYEELKTLLPMLNRYGRSLV